MTTHHTICSRALTLIIIIALAFTKSFAQSAAGVAAENNSGLTEMQKNENVATGKHSIAYVDGKAYEAGQEDYDFTLLDSDSEEAELKEFMTKYPNSRYSDQVSNLIAVSKAKNIPVLAIESSYASAMSYAKDDETRNLVKYYYEAKKREYSHYKKMQRKIKRDEYGGIVNFGIDAFELGFNTQKEEEYGDDYDYTSGWYCNLGAGIRLGRTTSILQLHLGVNFGIEKFKDEESYYEEYSTFQMPLYTRLKLRLCKFEELCDGVFLDVAGYYNAIKDSPIENKFSAAYGISLVWRHWDWRIFCKQNFSSLEECDDQLYFGTSFSYFF